MADQQALVEQKTFKLNIRFNKSWWVPILLTLQSCWALLVNRYSMVTVPPFNDSTMHQQMVTFATQSLQNFHLPLSQWYPLLNMGSPQFMHYQALGAMVAGALGIVTTPNFAFHLTLYLLTSLWPLCVYFAARTFGLSPFSALASALCAPFLSSFIQVGYEPRAYEWNGFGVYAQLWASWTLPFAWAWTWRAIHDRQHLWKAVLFISLTCAFHFETGYSAFAAVLVFLAVEKSDFKVRMSRCAGIVAGALAVSSWFLVPLLLNAKWASINNGQSSSPFALGYGAKSNLGWLFKGQYFDFLHWPVLTILFFVGVITSVVRWRRNVLYRAILILWLVLFLVSFGPTTWHSLVSVIPGHADIFFRRFIGPVQLCGLLIMGIGVSNLGVFFASGLTRFQKESSIEFNRTIRLTTRAFLVTMILLTGVPFQWRYQQNLAHGVSQQQSVEQVDQHFMNPILDYLHIKNDGRVYAGTPNNWGRQFHFGYGPMFLYLADENIPQTSTQAWAASLMENPQAQFDEKNLSDYQIMGAKYLLYPVGKNPPISARMVITSGPYVLYEVPSVHYFSIVQLSGFIDENKQTISRQSGYILRSNLFEHHVDLAVNYPSSDTLASRPLMTNAPNLGKIVKSQVHFQQNYASAVVDLLQPSTIVLSTSYDPGWVVTVDGNPAPTQVVAPALVAVTVPAGVHSVNFTYRGFQYYMPLFLLSTFSLIGFVYWCKRRDE
ncbi:MAG: YfhO family protein [Actinomycetota bacterium]